MVLWGWGVRELLESMIDIIIGATLLGILASLIVGAMGATSKRGRVIGGCAVFVWAAVMFFAASLVQRANFNIGYGNAARKLLDATTEALDAGKAAEVSRELKSMRKELRVTYENHGNFKELAVETAERMRSLKATEKP